MNSLSYPIHDRNNCAQSLNPEIKLMEIENITMNESAKKIRKHSNCRSLRKRPHKTCTLLYSHWMDALQSYYILILCSRSHFSNF